MADDVENKEVVYDGSTPLELGINEQFANAVIDSKFQSDAYRKVFGKEHLEPSSIHENASRLCNDIKIAARIRFLRKTLTDQCIWTREDSVMALKEVVSTTHVTEDGKTLKSHLAKDRVAATVALNKMSGFDAPAKVEVTGAGGSALNLSDFYGKPTIDK